MSRHNQIPLRMKVEGLRLVPASAFDQETIGSYQNGAVLQVFLWQGRNPDLLRKFWAIVGKVIETCNTPWEDKEEAADALKLALGITDVGSTVNGQMFVRPGSISFSAMDEAHFQTFFDKAMALLSKVTGVDVTELGREAADTGPDHDPTTGEIIEHETTESGPPPEPDATELSPSSVAEPADESPRLAGSPIPDATDPNGGPASGEDPAGGEIAPAQPSAGSDFERDILIRFARDILPQAADINVSAAALKAIEKRWGQGELAPLSEEAKETARQICVKMRKIANATNAPATLKNEAVELADVLGCSPADIGG